MPMATRRREINRESPRDTSVMGLSFNQAKTDNAWEFDGHRHKIEWTFFSLPKSSV